MGSAASLVFPQAEDEDEEWEDRELSALRVFLLGEHRRRGFAAWLSDYQEAGLAAASTTSSLCPLIDLFLDINGAKKNYVYIENNYSVDTVGKYLGPVREQLNMAIVRHAEAILLLSNEAQDNFKDLAGGEALLQEQSDIEDMVTFLEDVEGELLQSLRGPFGTFRNLEVSPTPVASESNGTVEVTPEPVSLVQQSSVVSLADLTLAPRPLDLSISGLPGPRPSILLVDDSSRLARLAVSLRLLPDDAVTDEAEEGVDSTPRQHLTTQLALELMKLKAFDVFVIDLDVRLGADDGTNEGGLDGLELTAMYRVWEATANIARAAQDWSGTRASLSTSTLSNTITAAEVPEGVFAPDGSPDGRSGKFLAASRSPMRRQSSFKRSPSSRNLKQRCVIVGLSSNVTPEKEALAKQSGMNHVLAKPLVEEAIFELMANAGRRTKS